VETDEEKENQYPAVTRRKIAAENLRKQAEKMVSRSSGILPPIKVGDYVLLAIPSFDRGRGDPANLVAVVIKEKEKKFRVATQHGILNRFVKVLRNSATFCASVVSFKIFVAGGWKETVYLAATKYHSLSVSDVTTNVEFSLRELVRLGSVGTGQGYRRCSCRQKCSTKCCTCFKNGYVCDSICHPGSSCDNHD